MKPFLLVSLSSCTLLASAQSLDAQVAAARTWTEHRRIVDAALAADRHVDLAQAYARARAKEDSLERQSGHALALARWCGLAGLAGIEKRLTPSNAVTSLLQTLRGRRTADHAAFSLLAQYLLDLGDSSTLEYEQTGTQPLVETWPDGSKRTVQAMVFGGISAGKRERLRRLTVEASRKAPDDPEARYYAALFENDPPRRLKRLLDAYRPAPERMSLFGLQQVVMAAGKVGDRATERRFAALVRERLPRGGMWTTHFLRSYPQYGKRA